MHRRPTTSLPSGTPVRLYLFDLLHSSGELLLAMPYTVRRERLAELGLDVGPVRTPPRYCGGAADVLAASLAHGPDGVASRS